MKKIRLKELKHRTKTLHIFGDSEKMTTDDWRDYPVTMDAYWGTDDQGRMWSKFKKDAPKTNNHLALCVVCNRAVADKSEWVCLNSVEQACEDCVTIEEATKDQVAHTLLKKAGLINNDHSKCPNCGYEKLESWFRFCVECGAKLKE